MHLILSAHGNLAHEILCSANMVFGAIDQLDAVSFLPGENAQTLKEKYKTIIETCDREEEILFLVDLFGGSPYNAAFETVVPEERMDVITGLSLPMLIDVVGIREGNKELKASQVYDCLSTDTYVRSCKTRSDEWKDEFEEDDEL